MPWQECDAVSMREEFLSFGGVGGLEDECAVSAFWDFAEDRLQVVGTISIGGIVRDRSRRSRRFRTPTTNGGRVEGTQKMKKNWHFTI